MLLISSSTTKSPIVRSGTIHPGEEASESLYRALGELGPQSGDRLLRDVEHPSERVRRGARAALSRAIHWSTPLQRFAILEKAIARLSNLSEADDWLRLLEHADGAFSPHGSPELREHVRVTGPDHETVLAWLAHDVRAVRAIATCVLAHRALEPRARAVLSVRIAADLPASRGAELERDGFGHRRPTIVELAVHILAVALPEALAAICAESEGARTALRDYALFELRRPSGEGLDGAHWFVAAALAPRLSDDPAVAEAHRESNGAASTA